MKTQCNYSLGGMAGLLTLLLPFLLLCGACGPKFTAHEFTEVSYASAGEGGEIETSGAGGESPSDNVGGTSGGAGEATGLGGLPSSNAGSGGLAAGGNPSSNGGATVIAGMGGIGGAEPHCLTDFETAECAIVCTHAPPSEIACMQLLSCMLTKNVGPAQGSLDPCYGTGYQDYQRAKLAYNNCCNEGINQ